MDNMDKVKAPPIDLYNPPNPVNDFPARSLFSGPERLLLLQCSDTKRDDQGPLAGVVRYSGPLYQTLRTVDPTGGMATVYILSAEYGLINGRTFPVHLYDREMTLPRAMAIMRHGIDSSFPNTGTKTAAQARALAADGTKRPARTALDTTTLGCERPFRDVLIVAGGEYTTPALALVWQMQQVGIIAPGASIKLAKGRGIGDHRATMTRWLRGTDVQLPKPPKPEKPMKWHVIGTWNGGRACRWQHPTNPRISVRHCCHPTALRPYYIEYDGESFYGNFGAFRLLKEVQERAVAEFNKLSEGE